MSQLVQKITKKLLNQAENSETSDKKKKFETFRAGDTVNVYVKVREGEKERVQIFKGIVLKIQGRGVTKSFTVRKISSGVGVERTFPFSSPMIQDVSLVSHGNIRKSRLYYLRKLEGRAAKVDSELAVTRRGRLKQQVPVENTEGTGTTQKAT